VAENLSEYLRERKGGGGDNFRPVPHYFPDGDFLTYHFRDEPCYARRVDDLLTVYLSMQTHEPVGCKLDGVARILRQAGDFGVSVGDGNVKLGFFLFLGAARARDADRRRHYEELKALAKDAAFDGSRLLSA
jgi:hypothetical protein